MFCTKCGNQIKDGFKFCPKCGTPVYVEKEKDESEVKAQVKEDVKKETSNKESQAKKGVDAKAKSKSTTSFKKSSESSSSNHNYIPNPLIAEELNIDGVKNDAEKGDEAAMLQQAFRYEMGIGVEKDVEKAKELYSRTNRRDIACADYYLIILDMITKNLCITKRQFEQYHNK